jgi:hypothetical protein
VAVVLAGCGSQPAHDEVAERFRIELKTEIGTGTPEALANRMAADALSGECSSEAYRRQLQPELAHAWDIGCLSYFEDQMTQQQIDRAKAESLNDIAQDARKDG